MIGKNGHFDEIIRWGCDSGGSGRQGKRRKLRRRNACEFAEFVDEVRLIVVAGSDRNVRPIPLLLARILRGLAETQNARQVLRVRPVRSRQILRNWRGLRLAASASASIETCPPPPRATREISPSDRARRVRRATPQTERSHRAANDCSPDGREAREPPPLSTRQRAEWIDPRRRARHSQKPRRHARAETYPKG